MWMDELTNNIQGRAGLVAFRRHRLGVNSAGKAFYKGYVVSLRPSLGRSAWDQNLTIVQWLRTEDDSP